MFKRVALALAALLAAAIAGFAGAGPAAATVPCTCGAQPSDQPTPYSPDDASTSASAPGSGSVSAATVEDPSTALAAASAPGADTSVESDLTPEQAVGLAPSPDSTSTTTTTVPTVCWTDQAWWQWGTWPYNQKITDTTHWCARYGRKITYRTTSVTTSGLLCGTGWRSGMLLAGGVGYPSFTERSSAGFSCPTDIPWITLHPTHHLDVKRDDVGNAAIVGSG